MASIADELQACFQDAVSALQAETASAAADSYFLARSRVRLVLEGHLGESSGAPCADPAAAVIAAACRQVESTLSLAIDRLSAPPDEQQPQPSSLPDASGCYAALPAGGTQQSPLHAGGGLALLDPRGSGGGDAGGWGHGGCDAAAAVAEAPAHLREVAQRCMREVSGSLDDVMGLAALKQELRETVLLPLHAPQLFVGLRRPQSNIMLHGPPGTGKTLLVERLAAEAGIPLLAVSPSSVLSKWSGESEKSLRAVFDAAAAMQPAIIFIDEIDAMAPTRSSGDDLSARRVLTELLLCMTALAGRQRCLVFILAATNRLCDCDPALLRRFERKVLVPPPDAEARASFFRTSMTRPEIASALSDEELGVLVEASEAMTGSDLATVCRDAAMAPLRELLAAVQAGALAVADLSAAAARPVTAADFLAAIERTRCGAE